MKTFKLIQIVVSAIGFIIALSFVDGLYPTRNELIAAMALVVTSGIGLIGQQFYAEDKG